MPTPAELVHPTPTYVRDEAGNVRAAFMRVRAGNAVRAIRPRPDAHVYFYLGADNRIVGIHMLENRPGVALEAVKTLLNANGVGERVSHAYITFEECLKLLREILDAIESMSQQMPKVPTPDTVCA